MRARQNTRIKPTESEFYHLGETKGATSQVARDGIALGVGTVENFEEVVYGGCNEYDVHKPVFKKPVFKMTGKCVVRDFTMVSRDKGLHPSRGKTVQRWKRKTLSVGGAKLFRRAM